MKNWIRLLYVKFYNSNTGKYYVVGNTRDDSKRPRIIVTGTKELSSIKDNFMIRIYNMTYKECINILMYELYNVQIFAGYYYSNDTSMNDNGKCIFDGVMINISNTKKDYKDNVFNVCCVSKVLGSSNQYRLNLSLNSNINMYSAIKWVALHSNISKTSISNDYKMNFYTKVKDSTSSSSSFLSSISNSNSSLFINTDSSNGKSSINAWDIRYEDKRTYNIDINRGMIVGDAPELTSNGLTWTSLPVMNYMPGDTVIMDNSYIDLSSGTTSSYSEVIKTFNTNYLDSEGKYCIWTLSYNLDNYAVGAFQISIKAKAKSLYTTITGG